MIQYLRGIFQPDIFHGFNRRPPYFEGWYFKLIDVSRKQRWAVIPGIFRAEDSAKDHSFIQVLDGVSGHATYHEYSVDAFWAHPSRFEVRVGDSAFSPDRISLAIKDDMRPIHGEIRFHNRVALPRSLYQPGIMGPFGYIPAMECYHGIVSLDHELDGALKIGNDNVDFSRGRGYIEKDWGTNFPSAYVWFQSNHFSAISTSLSASIARIPLWGLNFPGFIISLWHQGVHYRWATYTRAATERLRISDTCVEWVVANRKTRLSMTAERHAGGLLKAPLRTEMHKRVDETMLSAVAVRLETRDGRLLFEDCGDCTALEVFGEIDRLVTG
jgi:tocopherol cyclase